MKKHLNIYISGIVQGVFFRVYARNKAESLSLKGFAKNEMNESVYIEVEGDEKKLKQFVDWCFIGSPKSQVTRVEVKEGKLKHFNKFQVAW